MGTTIENAILPFKLQQFVAFIMEKKRFSLKDALCYLYGTELYNKLMDSSAKMWYLSTLILYDMLEKEKVEKRERETKDSAVLLFQIFCIENYKEEKHLSAEETLSLFIQYDVFDYLQQVFEMLHTQSREYIISEVATYIKNRKKTGK
ncbi:MULTISPECIES: DUF3791 domain-containing protein [Parabacteroides]|uniref:DUF3791 domain-containing protein n=1 Tax=Parabacteroides leei TaxID=2939491 RepID=UPI001897BDEA|nr:MULTISPECIES: DUF3791 domain-containing protein [Parabacteroides]MCL3851128.1 DUF3791 domain-containing protein [Parabacteroides leei]